MTFATALGIVLQLEGGAAFTDDPDDPGGPTKWGVTAETWRQAKQEGIIQDKPLAEATRDDAEAIYFSMYWRRVGADRLPAPLNLCVFDAAVNQGVAAAARLLQRTLRLDQDGVIGAETLSAAAHATRETAIAFLSARLQAYDDTGRRTVSGMKFVDGWRRRVLRLWRECVLDERAA